MWIKPARSGIIVNQDRIDGFGWARPPADGRHSHFRAAHNEGIQQLIEPVAYPAPMGQLAALKRCAHDQAAKDAVPLAADWLERRFVWLLIKTRADIAIKEFRPFLAGFRIAGQFNWLENVAREQAGFRWATAPREIDQPIGGRWAIGAIQAGASLLGLHYAKGMAVLQEAADRLGCA